MNKKWIDKKIKEEEQKAEEIYEKLKKLFIEQNFISKEWAYKILNELRNKKKKTVMLLNI